VGGETSVVEKISETVQANAALANMFVSVDPAAELFFGVVQVEKVQMPEAYEPVEILNGPIVGSLRSDIVARRKYMTGIQTDSKLSGVAGIISDAGQFFKSAAQ
jgi:hypothetical protein